MRSPVCRLFCFVLIALMGGSEALATERISLVPKQDAERLLRTKMSYEVRGTLKLPPGSQADTLKLEVAGHFQFDDAPPTSDDKRDKVVARVRHYGKATADIAIADAHKQAGLRESRQIVVIRDGDERLIRFSPAGPLRREELDLVTSPADPVMIHRLLPDEAVSRGGQWKHDTAVAARLLGLDAASESELTSRLIKADAAQATIHLSGKVQGAIDGIATEIVADGYYRFDRRRGMISAVSLSLEESRAAGHAAPGVAAKSRVKWTRAPIDTSSALTATRLRKISPQPSDEQLRLEFQSAAGRFSAETGREWHVLINEPGAAVLRMVKRGELIAQCKIHVPAHVGDSKIPKLEKFQADVRKALGDHFGRLAHVARGSTGRGYQLYRVDVEGEAEELPIRWIYYYLADQHGRRATLAFTVEAELVEQLGEQHDAIVESIRLLSKQETTAGRAAKPKPR